MTEKKKAVKGAEKKTRGDGPMPEKEIKATVASLERIARHEKDGIIVVLETFEENGRKGIQGKAFCANLGPAERVQALLPAMQVPKELLMLILMTGQNEE